MGFRATIALNPHTPSLSVLVLAAAGRATTGVRRERLPDPDVLAIPVVPDWICEVLSPSNAPHDRVVKRRTYTLTTGCAGTGSWTRRIAFWRPSSCATVYG